jgi:hypothetical protein
MCGESAWHPEWWSRLRDDTAESAAGTSEASPWRRYVIFVGPSRNTELYGLSWLDIEDRWRSASGVDLGEDLGLGWVIVAPQLPILNAKSIAPKREIAYSRLLGWVCGSGWVWDVCALNLVGT